jgi:hypothetical protein
MVDNLIDPSHSGHAVLSQNFLQHLEDLLPAHRTSINQAHNNPNMFDQGLRPGGAHLCGWRRYFFSLLQRWWFAAALVVGLFPLSSPLRPVIGHTASDRLPAAVGLTATKRTSKVFATDIAHILAPRIARIGEKEDPAMPASRQASSQVGLAFQNRSQQQIILQHQTANPLAPIPVRAKLKMLLDLCCKKT